MDNISTITETTRLPSHVLVQNQLQDIIVTQKNVIEKLSQDVRYLISQNFDKEAIAVVFSISASDSVIVFET
jgi:hypothetical protein